MNQRRNIVGNNSILRSGSLKKFNKSRSGGKRKGILVTRRNRRFGQTINRRNRLERAQYVSRNTYIRNRRKNTLRKFGRFGFGRRRNLFRRKLFVGGLHQSITNTRLYRLFRREGRLIACNVIYDRFGISRGFGIIEFANPRDALRTIQKWNNTQYMGFYLRIKYKRRKTRRLNYMKRNYGPYYDNSNYIKFQNRKNKSKFKGREFRGFRNNYY